MAVDFIAEFEFVHEPPVVVETLLAQVASWYYHSVYKNKVGGKYPCAYCGASVRVMSRPAAYQCVACGVSYVEARSKGIAPYWHVIISTTSPYRVQTVFEHEWGAQLERLMASDPEFKF